MEKHILELEASGYKGELSLEDYALDLAIEETYEKNGKRWKPWAKNARSLRAGDIILIVDSDTIVPEVSTALRFYFNVTTYHSIYRTALGTRHVSLPNARRLPSSSTNRASTFPPVVGQKQHSDTGNLRSRCYAGGTPLL